MLQKITRRELAYAQAALAAAILLQVLVWRANHGFSQAQWVVVVAEVAMVGVVSFSSRVKTLHSRALHRFTAVSLLALLSAANASSLIVVIHALITGASALSGLQLLASAVAIFATNIIIFALWYWEIDSPGLTRKRWSARDKDFQFTQQDLAAEFPGWQPQFVDYLYLSLTNAINFAPADARPLTRSVKLLLAAQALVSVFTIALVVARSVSILGT